MANNPQESVRTAALLILATFALIAGLYIGGEFLVPIALALILNALFRPIVRWLEKFRFATPIGAGIVVLTLVALMTAAAYALATPVKNWFSNAPQYFSTAQQKLSRLRQPVQKITEVANQAKSAMDGATTAPSTNPTTGPSAAASDPPAADPAPATVVPSAPPTLTIHTVWGTTTQIVGGLVEVILLLYLLLASGSMFVDKLVALLPERTDKQIARESVDESERAVLRYMFVTALINLGQGILVGLCMWWLGLSSPLLWGLFTFVLEFVPYLGALGMIIMLAITSVASFDTLPKILAAPAIYLVITTVQNNLVSPWAYGKGLKMNPVAVLIGVLFWWYVWGIPGAFLAVPILAVVKIVTDRTERFRAVGEFLGE